MKNYLSQITESQRKDLKQRLVLELFIENFSVEDLKDCFPQVSQERLTTLALSLIEEAGNVLPPKAFEKYDAIAEAILNCAKKTSNEYYIQSAQVLADFGQQHELL